MKVNLREFLDCSYNHGYITIVNNIPSDEPGDVNKTLWEGKYETIDHFIPIQIQKLNVVKWGVFNNGIVIWVNYVKGNK